MRKILVTLLCLTGAACQEAAQETPPEVVAARREAARRACISEQLVQKAQDQLEVLESGIGGSGLVTFARAYQQHALLRLSGYAQLDSALNHSASSADSARHARTAAAHEIRVPSEESVEASVIRNYESDFQAIYSDADHPCNWKAELEEEGVTR